MPPTTTATTTTTRTRPELPPLTCHSTVVGRDRSLPARRPGQLPEGEFRRGGETGRTARQSNPFPSRRLPSQSGRSSPVKLRDNTRTVRPRQSVPFASEDVDRLRFRREIGRIQRYVKELLFLVRRLYSGLRGSKLCPAGGCRRRLMFPRLDDVVIGRSPSEGTRAGGVAT
jgi:hypothetical protein